MNKQQHSRRCSFADVKEGELFRILRPDIIGERKVENNGLYAKVSATIAVDIAHGNKDIIPTFKIPCHVLPKLVNIKHLETYKVCHRRG